MASTARLKVEIIGDASSAVQATKTTEQSFSGLSSSIGTFARVASAALVGSQIVRFLGDAVSAASDLNETVSKSNTIFGANAKAIDKWASTAAESFGQSRKEALDAAAGFGNMFTQLGVGIAPATKMSKTMVELASDFASFHNADITQVLEAQQAAFRGEYDAVQRFVPTINAATVETKALAQTGKESAKELTAQEKATAAYTLMVEGAGKATGDFERTSEGLANQQRILNARWADAKAQLGTAFMPLLLELLPVATGLLDVFTSLPTEVQALLVVVGGSAVAFAPLIGAVGDVARLASSMISTGGSLAKFGQFLATGGVFAVLVGMGVATVLGLKKAFEDTTAEIDVTGKQLGRFTDDQIRKLIRSTQDAVKVTGDSSLMFKQFQLTLDDTAAAARYIEVAKDMGINTDKMTAALERQIQKNVEADAAHENARKKMDELAQSYKDAAALPPVVFTVDVNTDDAKRRLDEIIDKMGDVDLIGSDIGFRVGPAMAPAPAAARTLVGPRGLAAPAPVAGVRAAPTAVTINVTSTGLGASAPEIQRAVANALRGYTRRNGALDIPIKGL